MRVLLLLILCAVASKDAVAESGNEVKRSAFSFMAFLYYSDETILDSTGGRFTRSAILISDNWLISSSDVTIGFPKKTLLARLGAITIDNNITLNEDEEEQEREIILIIRPYNYSTTEWWYSDISLLKTLLPFNTTLSVAPAELVGNPGNTEKTCFILVYAKRNGNATERNLIQMPVELLPPTSENCGSHFKKETMACAVDSNDKTNAKRDPNFCQGNSGGPLICDNELTGLQTYINDCKEPYLYQLLTVWEKLITCVKEEQYLSGSCTDISVILSKDPPVSSTPEIVDAERTDLFGAIRKAFDDKYLNSSITTMKEVSTAITASDELVPTTVTEINNEPIFNNTSTLTTNNSYNTTLHASSELLAYAEEHTVDATEESERSNHVQARHQTVRGGASMMGPYVFHYLITSILAYLT